jgi:hypothetical protein
MESFSGSASVGDHVFRGVKELAPSGPDGGKQRVAASIDDILSRNEEVRR